MASLKSDDKGGLRKRRGGGDSSDEGRDDGGSEVVVKSGFSVVHIVIIAMAAFLFGRLQQTYSA